ARLAPIASGNANRGERSAASINRGPEVHGLDRRVVANCKAAGGGGCATVRAVSASRNCAPGEVANRASNRDGHVRSGRRSLHRYLTGSWRIGSRSNTYE